MKSYKNISDPQRSFLTAYVEKHSQKNHFFNEIRQVIDWDEIDKELKKVYKKGMKERGAKAYSPLLLFKMQLIAIWYNLSDMQTEIMVNDSISAIKFCDLTIEDDVPGHTTLSRFRKVLIDKKVYDGLIHQVNNQLGKKNYKIIPGKAKIDARLLVMN
jgi:IS5 family transposase